MRDGKCGAHEYSNYNQARIDTLLSKLKAHNFIVIGGNPGILTQKNTASNCAEHGTYRHRHCR